MSRRDNDTRTDASTPTSCEPSGVDKSPDHTIVDIHPLGEHGRTTKPVEAAVGASSTIATRPTSFRRRLMIADAASILVGFAASFLFQFLVKPVPLRIAEGHAWLMLASLPAFALGAGANHLYQARANELRLEETANLLKTVGVGISWILLLAVAIQYDDLSRLWVGSTATLIVGALFLERGVTRSLFRRMRAEGRFLRRIVIVGTDTHALNLMRTYEQNPGLGYSVVGFAGDDDVDLDDELEILGSIDDLVEILDQHEAVGVVVSLASVVSEDVNVLTRRLTDVGYHVALSSSLRDIDVGRLRPQTFDGRAMIYVEPISRNGWHAIAKRCFDLGVALLMLVLSLPVQLIAAVAIATSSRGPVFFRQIRVGQNGELFVVLKFRTMYRDAEERKAELMDRNEADGPLFKMKNDPRITPVGRILRKLSIDELPQLMCVLIGSMSMVGPRPALPSEVEQWDEDVRERLRVPPGLTGMWQVSGRSDSSFETYKRMDLYYVDNWSLMHDLRICFRTIGVVLRGTGAS